MAIIRTGKDRRPRGPNGSRAGQDTRSYTAIAELGNNENDKRLRRWKSFSTQREVKAWLVQTTGEVHKGTYVEPNTQTVREFAREWLEAIRPSLKPSTAFSYESVIRLYINPAMGGVRLASVTSEMVGKLYSGVQAQGLSSRTARYAGQILKTLLASAVREGKLPRNPAEHVKPPRHEPVRFLGTSDGQEVRRFLEAAKNSHLFPTLRLAATTGMRRAEVAGLRWGDVDLSEGRVSVRHARVMSGGRAVDTTPKTGRSVRMISLDQETAEVLREHKLAQMQVQYPSELRAEDDVFTNWRGGRLSPETLSYEFEKIAATIPGLPDLTLHGLRHTWATLALRAGIHVKVVSERLGTLKYRYHAEHLLSRDPGNGGGSCRKGGRSPSSRGDNRMNVVSAGLKIVECQSKGTEKPATEVTGLNLKSGGAGGIRTPYLLTASQTLSQLSYSPTNLCDALRSPAVNT